MKKTIIITGKAGVGKTITATGIKNFLTAYGRNKNVTIYPSLIEDAVINVLQDRTNEIAIITTQVPAEKFDTTGCTVISITEH